MNTFTKTLVAAGLAGAGLMASPAAAQVSGNIAIVNAPAAIAASAALRTAYQQIGTTYGAQITQVQQKQQQVEALLKQLDKNNDGQLDQAEQTAAAKAPQATQIQTLEREIGTVSNQIDSARVYAVEQILMKYAAAQQSVVTANKIQLVLSPDAVAWAAPAANITDKVVTALNTAVPSVQIVPPQGWQPSQQSVAAFQQVQQILMIASARAQAAQPQQPAPTGR